MANVANYSIKNNACLSLTNISLFPLPSQRAMSNVPGQGWKTATTVKASKISGAGNGRFSDVDLPKNTIIMVKPMISMANVTSIKSIANDECIVFKSIEEVKRFISLYEKEARQDREDILDCLAHFIGSFSTIDGVAINFCSVMVNHGDPGNGQNIRFYEKDGVKFAETITDVKAGDELHSDYRDFDYMDEFWIQFCKDEGIKDVLTNLRQFIDL